MKIMIAVFVITNNNGNYHLLHAFSLPVLHVSSTVNSLSTGNHGLKQVVMLPFCSLRTEAEYFISLPHSRR